MPFGESSSFSPPNYLDFITGDKEVLTALQKKIKKYQIPAVISFDHALRWPQDCRVVLADRTHLIPAFPSMIEDKIFYSLLPSLMLHFVAEKQCYVGNGISEMYQERARTLAIKYKIPYRQGLSCIEGGNCQIFKGADGKAKAIVGYNSLVLTILSLLKENVFAKEQEKLDQYIAEHPKLSSSDSLRVARNFFSVLHGIDCPLEKALDPEEEAMWMEGARKIEALFSLGKQTISDELGISLERIAFVLQERFHIDMELFVGPDEFVFLHDEQLMLDFQQKIEFPFSFLKNTRKYSESHLALNQKILEENTKALEQIGCRVFRVPGVLTAEYEEGSNSYSQVVNDWIGQETLLPREYQDGQKLEPLKCVNLLNFMNGFFFAEPTPRWIVAGAPKGHPITNLLKNAFKEAIHAQCPDLRISMIRTAELATRLIVGSGGLRCRVSPL